MLKKFIEENPGYAKKLALERAADEEKSPDEKDSSKDKTPDVDPADKKKEDKKNIKVDIGQRPGSGGFGKFRFLKKEGDKAKETKGGKEETKEKMEVKYEPQEELELRKSAEPAKQQPTKEMVKEDSSVVKDPKRITIKISTPRHFVPHSVAKPPAASPIPPKPVPKVTMPVHVKTETKGKPVVRTETHASKSKFKSRNKLDSFLSIGEQGKSLPVIKEPEKPAAPSDDQIAEAFSGSANKGDAESAENDQKPSFSDTLRKMLFTSSQRQSDDMDISEDDEEQEEEEEGPKLPPPKRPPGLMSPEKKSTTAATKSLFDALLGGGKKLPGIPGIDDDDMAPPGT